MTPIRTWFLSGLYSSASRENANVQLLMSPSAPRLPEGFDGEQIDDMVDVVRSITLNLWFSSSLIRMVLSFRNIISEGLLTAAVDKGPSLYPLSKVVGVRAV